MCMFCSYWQQMIGGMGFGLAAILSSSPLAHLIIKQFASGSSGVSKHHENINTAFQELWQASQERLRSVLLGSHEIEEKYLLQIGKIFQSFAGLSWCRSCFRWSLCPDILTSSRALSAMQIQTLPFLGDACLLYIIYIYIWIYMGPWVHSGLYAQATPGPLFALLQGVNKRHVDRLTPLTWNWHRLSPLIADYLQFDHRGCLSCRIRCLSWSLPVLA